MMQSKDLEQIAAKIKETKEKIDYGTVFTKMISILVFCEMSEENRNMIAESLKKHSSNVSWIQRGPVFDEYANTASNGIQVAAIFGEMVYSSHAKFQEYAAIIELVLADREAFLREKYGNTPKKDDAIGPLPILNKLENKP